MRSIRRARGRFDGFATSPPATACLEPFAGASLAIPPDVLAKSSGSPHQGGQTMAALDEVGLLGPDPPYQFDLPSGPG